MPVSFVDATLRRAWESQRLRGAAIGTVAVVSIATVVRSGSTKADLVEGFAWAQLLVSIVVGGYLTGWRVSQFPKTRTAEFQLVTPVGDWELIGRLVLGGGLRTAMINVVTAPAVAAMWGAGWITAAGAIALVAVPIAGGCLAGLVLAVVAYEPHWVRRLLERSVLGGVLGYLVLFGLFGPRFVPWLRAWWAALGPRELHHVARLRALVAHANPFDLLYAVAHESGTVAPGRVATVLAVLGVACGLCLWRMVCRLRAHYVEENYCRQFGSKEYGRPIGDNPLAWWTARRVNRFKGNVNLYLAWATTGLYAAWIVAPERWPSWLALDQLRALEQLGGESLLAVAALQLAVVPVAFLNGLWDSSDEQRARRFELLLATPLVPRQFLVASAVAGWSRGRGYVLATLTLWIAATTAGRLPWWSAAVLSLVAANYLLLSFAVAFRNFAPTHNDRAATMRGLAWSVGGPLATMCLLAGGGGRLALLTPLGGIYLASLPDGEVFRATGLATWEFWLTVAAVNLLYLSAAWWLIGTAVRHFNREVRGWFADYLGATSSSPEPAAVAPRGAQPSRPSLLAP